MQIKPSELYNFYLIIFRRDLKCENLLLGKDNKLILSDFGFCKFVNYDFNGNVEPSATFCGSAAYAAPETLQGKSNNVDLEIVLNVNSLIKKFS